MFASRLFRMGSFTRSVLAVAVITSTAHPAALAAAPTFKIDEATIDGIQAAILKGELTSTQVV